MTNLNSEHIIGEERVGDGIAFAKRMVEEAERMWSSGGWKRERNKGGVLVESKPVAGVLAPANIRVMRSSGEISADSQTAFAFLTSPAGFAILDPVSKAEDHQLPPLEQYTWRKNSRLEAAIASAKEVPMLPEVEFVVLNAIDYDSCRFVSKSILHDQRPGGSHYSGEPPVPSAKPRALNTFAVKTLSLSHNRCQLLCINYVDMGAKGPSWIYDFINRRYFAPLYRRLSAELAKR